MPESSETLKVLRVGLRLRGQTVAYVHAEAPPVAAGFSRNSSSHAAQATTRRGVAPPLIRGCVAVTLLFPSPAESAAAAALGRNEQIGIPVASASSHRSAAFARACGGARQCLRRDDAKRALSGAADPFRRHSSVAIEPASRACPTSLGTPFLAAPEEEEEAATRDAAARAAHMSACREGYLARALRISSPLQLK
ncbi:hypothetical protein MRX96_036122 [Rhipicephalus microplus]